eukprot:TRINITY_DN14816_c0_g1_i1.p1 TRINITY_DN14816_c0_g1~~TRINITY_DN14816_c0_g1_i1.p1  ORF type:complete len:272 (+),score=39.45 TRINITY_DN14816_c0_g1_i1:1-816(+)
MEVFTIPKDTFYSYLVIDERTNLSVAIDPIDTQQILEVAKFNLARISTIFLTNCNNAYIPAVEKLLQEVPGLTIHVGSDDFMPELKKKRIVVHRDKELGFGTLKIRCFSVRYSGHLMFFVEGDKTSPIALFCGEELTVGGSLFRYEKNSPLYLYHALYNLEILQLPGSTRIYCSREFSIQSLTFAIGLEPSNLSTVQSRLDWAKKTIAQKLPAVPSTIEDERTYNPFLRVHLPEIKAKLMLPLDAKPLQTMEFLIKKFQEQCQNLISDTII